MHDELRDDEQRQRHEQADMELEVPQKRYGNRVRPDAALRGRQEHERQPAHERNDENSLTEQCERVVGEVRASEELEQRSPENQRKKSDVVSEAAGGLCPSEVTAASAAECPCSDTNLLCKYGGLSATIFMIVVIVADPALASGTANRERLQTPVASA
jgi:hypothetical protein